MQKTNVGFISTRLAGTDGVSLETFKWNQVLERSGYKCFAFAGELQTPSEDSFLEPKAHFNDPEILELHEDCYGRTTRPASLSKKIHELKDYLKKRIYEYCFQFDIDLFIAENILTIPMHLPLGMALTEFIAETGMPTVAHHHDFAWERDRFLINAVQDYLDYAFPPNLKSIRHVVINSKASRELSYRRGISNIVIPNVFDFANPPENSTKRETLREELGLANDDLFILQPTRIVPRKWIERAIEMVSLMELNNPKLIVSHKTGDEGGQYAQRVMEYAYRLGVELVYIGHLVDSTHCFNTESHEKYTIDDVYQAADLVTYPSGYEGFGNAFVEALYFKKPIVLNRYSIFIEDIEPCGFKVISFDSFVTRNTVKQIKGFLKQTDLDKVLTTNYFLGQTHFSYEVLEHKLFPLIESLFLVAHKSAGY
ncbi:MAG: glycosyltransferase family 4 protein [Deltaproteobacteria bacterium]|nr:glycosyltransferase family 4 protein [Deltaproteobacteria bacterium]MBW2050664.1 glycosyltransferase family 4 protein [Deltaproteobacteria bacterium]MBW2139582.1 glycosyltransferase family 4 protein [Deltaproteobacteria bacterium]MBW2322939.1 glycosyltransferase family 4 protein [Deltaproteobacteria bacterium]